VVVDEVDTAFADETPQAADPPSPAGSIETVDWQPGSAQVAH
jgi:hypothetical protein